MKSTSQKPESEQATKPKSETDLKSLPMPELLKKLGSSPDGLSQGRGTETTGAIWP